MSRKNTGPNVSKLLELVGVFTLYPERQDQNNWFGEVEKAITAKDLRPGKSCGTTLCTAGWAAVLYGPKEAIFSPDEHDVFFVPNPFGNYYVTKNKVLNWDDCQWDVSRKPGLICDKVNISDFAEKELRLSEEQSFALFYRASNVEEVLAVIRKIITSPRANSDELDDALMNVRYPG